MEYFENIIYTRDGPVPLKNQGRTCLFNAIIQAFYCCDRIRNWVNENPSTGIQLEGATNRELFAWRVLRAVEDVREFGLRQLPGQNDPNSHTAHFQLPSCLNRAPNITSWAGESPINPASSNFVNWTDKDICNIIEIPRSAREERWSGDINPDDNCGQEMVEFMTSTYRSIMAMEEHDTDRQARKEQTRLCKALQILCKAEREYSGLVEMFNVALLVSLKVIG